MHALLWAVLVAVSAQAAAPRRTVSSPGAPVASGPVPTASPVRPSALPRAPAAFPPTERSPGFAAAPGAALPAVSAPGTVPLSPGAGLAAAAGAPTALSPAAALAAAASGAHPAGQGPSGAGVASPPVPAVGTGGAFPAGGAVRPAQPGVSAQATAPGAQPQMAPGAAPRTPSSPAVPAMGASVPAAATPFSPPPPPAPPPPVTPLGFAEAQAQLAASPDREHIARTVLRFAIGKFKRAILLSVQGQVVTGWHGLGQLREAGVKRIGLSLRAQNTFRLVRDTRSHYVGPMKRDAGTLVFYKLLGGGYPTTAVLLPLLVRGKVVHMLYVDNGADQLTPPDIGELLILSQSVARSYEALMQRRKRS